MKIILISTLILSTISSDIDNPGQNQVSDTAISNSKLEKRSFLGWIRKKFGIKSKNDPDEYYDDEDEEEENYYSTPRSKSRSRRYRADGDEYLRRSRSKFGRQRHFDDDDEDYEPRRRSRSSRGSRRKPRRRYDD
jgi:hypothetical protein